LAATEGSPGLGIGDTLATFHSAGKTACFRDELKRAVTVGEMLSAVPRSILPEIPSGPDAVLIFWVENSINTSSCVQDTLDRVGPLGAVVSRSGLCASV